jgi:hypothetical protein
MTRNDRHIHCVMGGGGAMLKFWTLDPYTVLGLEIRTYWQTALRDCASYCAGGEVLRDATLVLIFFMYRVAQKLLSCSRCFNMLPLVSDDTCTTLYDEHQVNSVCVLLSKGFVTTVMTKLISRFS